MFIKKSTPPKLILQAIILNTVRFTRYYECGIPGSVISVSSALESRLYFSLKPFVVPKMAFNA